VGALPPSELAAFQVQLAECSECRKELEELQPTVDALVAWPTSVLRPAASLWDRLAQRVAADTGMVAAPTPATHEDPRDWDDVAPGISVKILAADEQNGRVSMLVRLASHTAYPPHRHADAEELHLLDGELWIEDQLLRPGDYHVARAGAVDQRVYSETGCTCVLITSLRDAIL
jgi:hypothetical protein